ncbi:MAG: thiamine pyrophosphate-binding protein [Actinomycetota bacterium]
MDARYGSDVVVDLLQGWGFPYVPLNPGSSFRGLHDSIVNYGGDRPQIITCPHEKVAVGIAHGYAKASGRPLPVILHDLVGLLHGTLAIYYAYIDRVPILVFGGSGPMDITQRRPNIDWIHSANVQGNAVRDFTKWDDEPRSIAAIPEVVARAYRVAMTEPRGPVYVALDAGLQEDVVEGEVASIDLERVGPPAPIGPDPAALDELAGMLAGAERPVIIPGYAGRDPAAFDHLIELAELLAAGVVDTNIRLNFPTGNELNVTGSDVLENSDAVLFLDVKDMGKPAQSLDSTTRRVRSRIPKEAKVLSLGFDDLNLSAWSHDFAALHATDLSVTADSSIALPLLVRACHERVASDRRDRGARRAELARIHARTRATWESEARAARDDAPVSTARLATEVWEAVREYDWVLTAGTANDWALKLWDFDRPYRHPGRSIGTATQFGISIGVALAHREAGRLVVDLQPDGDLMFDVGALWVPVHYGIPLLVVMFNNRSYFNDLEHQERLAVGRDRPAENAHVGMDLDKPAPDFAAVARGFGWHAEGPIEAPGALGGALRRAVAVVAQERRPALVDVVCQAR